MRNVVVCCLISGSENTVSDSKYWSCLQIADITYIGMGPDFRVLVRKSRKQAEQYHRLYKEPIPVTQLVRETAAVMQEFTQSGGVRPFGVSLLVAGYDDNGPQLYQVLLIANIGFFEALHRIYTDDMELDDAVHTAILTLKEGFEGQISGKNIEIGIIGTDRKFRQAPALTLSPFSLNFMLLSIQVLTPAEIDDYLAEVEFVVGNTLNHVYIQPRSYKPSFKWMAKNSSSSDVAIEKWKRDGVYIDKRGKLRTFHHKKLSRKRCGSLRGQGWKYGSGFVDGVFPVLGPIAQQILDFLQQEVDADRVWSSLDNLSPSHSTWDDLINVAVQLRLNKKWDPIVLLCEWILQRSSFQLDVMCFNLLIDAYGQKSLYKKVESTYLELLEARCVPTEDTYALLVKAYCTAGLKQKAEAVFAEMRKYGLSPSATVYNAYIDGLMKGGNSQKAIEVFQRMKRDGCQLNTETYTLMINLYGKASKSYMALKLFDEMRSQKCKPNICTYTALVNAFAREGLCEKAEEIFEQLQEAGYEPDVYAYNALMEAYRSMQSFVDSLVPNSRAGYPYGAAEVFSLMQHMGCEPDRASFNIMVDAYGRAGLYEDAESVFEEMKKLGITPTMKSHMLLLSAYSRVGNIAKCENIVNQIQEFGLQPDTFVLNSMLNLYGKLGQFENMEKVLVAMEKGPYEADISTYNILINVYGRAGYFNRMEELFQSLPAKNLTPDVVTWTSRLGAYSRKKLYQRCLEIFEEMIDAGCYPDGGTAKVLLSACSSEDQIEQITTVIRTMHKDMKTVLPI
ncbi:pentatricopeptide repeat-containing protein [Gossypium australe]|uniref:Pentatricopeptide repeat-containing protein n=1 Tax=Gossypium australe TaxID=47621 RepID=A0A5B6WD79_9ROSI|nr:pentatricopeptide repeat-containing protein [Gossypium australe]